MGTRALVFLLLAACSNDQFAGQDAADEAAPPKDATAEGADDAAETGPSTDSGPKGFCATQSGAFFCDDFDVLAKATDSFSVTTPASPPAGVFDFGQGKSDKGLVVTASGLVSTAYVTKQVQSDVLHGFTFAIQVSAAVANVTYVRVQAQSSSFVLAADGLAQNLTIRGDSGNAQNVFKPDGKWHVLDVHLASGSANVAIDGGVPIAVPFAAQSSMTSTLDVGIVTAALAGGSALFDDLALR